VIDFKGQVGWYVLLKGEEIIYIGKTVDRLWSRLAGHYNTKYRHWDRFSWFGVYAVDEINQRLIKKHTKIDPKSLIGDIETLLIYLSGGMLNKVGGKNKHMMEFKQVGKGGRQTFL